MLHASVLLALEIVKVQAEKFAVIIAIVVDMEVIECRLQVAIAE